MNVNELIAHLQKIAENGYGELEIIVGSDDEGNDFNWMWAPSVDWCVEDDTRCGYRPVHPDDVGTEYDEEDLERLVVM